MSYKVQVPNSVLKQLKKIPQRDKTRLVAAIDKLSQDPYPKDCKKLKGSDDLYRVLCGDYRIIYSIENKILVVLIVKNGHRRDVYSDS